MTNYDYAVGMKKEKLITCDVCRRCKQKHEPDSSWYMATMLVNGIWEPFWVHSRCKKAFTDHHDKNVLKKRLKKKKSSL